MAAVEDTGQAVILLCPKSILLVAVVWYARDLSFKRAVWLPPLVDLLRAAFKLGFLLTALPSSTLGGVRQHGIFLFFNLSSAASYFKVLFR